MSRNFILKTLPIHGTEKVPLDTNIQVNFMIDLNMQYVSPDTVVLFNLDEQVSELVDVEYKHKWLTIKPKNGLKPLMHYQVNLVGGNEGIRDITGQIMHDTYTFEFNTADVKKVQPPVIISPSDQSDASVDVVFKWNPAADAYFYELEISKKNTFQNLIWPVQESRIYETEIQPAIDYTEGRYYARIRTVTPEGIKSAFSDPIQFYVEPTVDPVVLDTGSGTAPGTGAGGSSDPQLDTLIGHFTPADEAPQLLIADSIPNNQALHMSVNSLGQIEIEFSEDIDPASVTKDTCYIVVEKN